MTQPLNTEPFNSMDPEIKLDFVEALRSGRYTKGKRALRENDCFCVLGVLTDIAVQRGIVEWEAASYNTKRMGIRDEELDYVDDGFISKRVCEWAGVVDDNGDIRFGKHQDATLMTLNDRFDYNFEQIADIVEESL